MRVLLCERKLTGHRRQYLNQLASIEGIDFFSYAPENTGFAEDRFFFLNAAEEKKSLSAYVKWIAAIRRIVRENGIDVVHFLDGDSIMRFFGLGMHALGKARVLITYHHFFPGVLRKLSYQLMNAGRKHVCVVHTDAVKEYLQTYHIGTVYQCDYPAFEFARIAALDPKESKTYFGCDDNVPTIGIVGGMNAYKNIVPYLHILQRCTEDFRLRLCGAPKDVTEEEIDGAIAPYREKVKKTIRMLTDREYKTAIAASDIIYSIYNLDFDGASGPLTDGVCAGKMILSASHGSLGEIVTSNALGLTADVTDDADILRKTEAALRQAPGFQYGEKAACYRERLKPEYFYRTYGEIYRKLSAASG